MAESGASKGFGDFMGGWLNMGLPIVLIGLPILLYVAGGATVVAGAVGGPVANMFTATGTFNAGAALAQMGQGAVNIGVGATHLAGAFGPAMEGGDFFGTMGDALMTPLSSLA